MVHILAPHDKHSRFSRKEVPFLLLPLFREAWVQGVRAVGGRLWVRAVLVPQGGPLLSTQPLCTESTPCVPFSVSLMAALISTFLSKVNPFPGVFPALPTSPQRLGLCSGRSRRPHCVSDAACAEEAGQEGLRHQNVGHRPFWPRGFPGVPQEAL